MQFGTVNPRYATKSEPGAVATGYQQSAISKGKVISKASFTRSLPLPVLH